MITPNQAIGEFRVANIRFLSWAYVPEELSQVESVVGLTSDGALIQVATLEGRKIARLLSGPRQIREFTFTASGHLLAVDRRGRAFAFIEGSWSRSPVRQLVGQGLTLWTISTAALAAVLHEMMGPSGDIQSPLYWAAVLGLAAGQALNVALLKAMQFDLMNQTPTGLRDLGVRLMQGESLGSAMTALEARAQSQFGAAGNLDPGCANDFLPRPPEAAMQRIEY